MGKFEFTFPDVGEGIQEGTIVSWKIKKGDQVKADQILAEVETDKAVVEIPSPRDGKILRLHAKKGGIIKVGEVIVTLEVSGEGNKVLTKKVSTTDAAEKAGGVVGMLPESAADLAGEAEKKVENPEGVLVTPAIRKLAIDKGVEISKLRGTGPGGRITFGDVKNAMAGTTAVSENKTEKPAGLKVVKKYDMWGYVDHKPLKGMRKAIATHMEQSWKAPLVTHHDEADVTELVFLRANKKEKGVKLSYLSYIIKAVIAAMKNHPMINASFDRENEDIIIKKYYNIGVAVDTGEGLVVPVLKGAEKKTLPALSKEISMYAEKAKAKKLDLMDMKGGTFTITNVGVLGGTYFTPLLNSPEVAILGVGKMQDKPVALEGKIVIRKILPFSLSFDHRVLDGAEAARFVTELIQILGYPKKLK